MDLGLLPADIQCRIFDCLVDSCIYDMSAWSKIKCLCKNTNHLMDTLQDHVRLELGIITHDVPCLFIKSKTKISGFPSNGIHTTFSGSTSELCWLIKHNSSCAIIRINFYNQWEIHTNFGNGIPPDKCSIVIWRLNACSKTNVTYMLWSNEKPNAKWTKACVKFIH